jgi:hypothetical protein
MARKRMSPDQPSSETEYFLYRGVHANHPALADAMEGRIMPGMIHGSVSPEQHNRGNVSDISPYTSWTAEREVAEYNARRFGPGGVILILPSAGPEPHDEWSWEPSPDIFDEQEILLRGRRGGATVELL